MPWSSLPSPSPTLQLHSSTPSLPSTRAPTSTSPFFTTLATQVPAEVLSERCTIGARTIWAEETHLHLRAPAYPATSSTPFNPLLSHQPGGILHVIPIPSSSDASSTRNNLGLDCVYSYKSSGSGTVLMCFPAIGGFKGGKVKVKTYRASCEHLDSDPESSSFSCYRSVLGFVYLLTLGLPRSFSR